MLIVQVLAARMQVSYTHEYRSYIIRFLSKEGFSVLFLLLLFVRSKKRDSVVRDKKSVPLQKDKERPSQMFPTATIHMIANQIESYLQHVTDFLVSVCSTSNVHSCAICKIGYTIL